MRVIQSNRVTKTKNADEEAKALIDSGVAAATTALAAAHPDFAPLLAVTAEMSKHVMHAVVLPRVREFGRWFFGTPPDPEQARAKVESNPEVVQQVLRRLFEVDPCAVPALARLADDYCGAHPKRVDVAFRGFLTLFATITYEHFETLKVVARHLELVARWNEPVWLNWQQDKYEPTLPTTRAQCFTREHATADEIEEIVARDVPGMARVLLGAGLAVVRPPVQGAFFSDIDRGERLEWSEPVIIEPAVAIGLHRYTREV